MTFPAENPRELTADKIQQLFTELDYLLLDQPTSLLIVGGAALALHWADLGTYDRGTYDIDAVPILTTYTERTTFAVDTVTEPLPHHLQEAVLTLARKYNLDDDWLNNNVIRYISPKMDLQPTLIWSGAALQIYRPDIRTLLVMKIFSLREEDTIDTVRLIEETGINTAERLQSLVKSVSGSDHLPVIVEEHIGDILREHTYLMPTPET